MIARIKNKVIRYSLSTPYYLKISIFILAKLKTSILSNNPAVTEAGIKTSTTLNGFYSSHKEGHISVKF